jgi:hypothetical protein
MDLAFDDVPKYGTRPAVNFLGYPKLSYAKSVFLAVNASLRWLKGTFSQDGLGF